MSEPVEATPAGLRRIAIDPLSRVEGHGKVTLLLDDAGRVHQVRLHIVEFRGFERFIEGRPYWEVPVMVQRLCGICPVSHHLAASKALDRVIGVAELPRTAELVRRLMHYGQILQSHALHFYHLSSPDLLFGFGSDPAQRNLVGLATTYPELAKQGILLRKLGQQIIEVTAGKRIHGTGSVPGGVNRSVSLEDRQRLLAAVPAALAWAEAGVALIAKLHDEHAELYASFGTVPSNLLSLVRSDGALDLYDGVLRVRDADGRIVIDGLDPQRYRERLKEEVRSWSYMKFPFVESLGVERGWYKVGPLARVQNCDFIDTPAAEAARQAWRARSGGALVHAPLAYHWARMIELLHAVEVVERLLGDEALSGSELTSSGAHTGEGVGILEAPRGTLIHHYKVDAQDLVTMCNLIVSTTHNNQAMNEAIAAVAHEYLDGEEPTEALLNHIEVAIRAFDPCLSCATHALGKMPLVVETIDRTGAVVGRLQRNSDGSFARGAP